MGDLFAPISIEAARERLPPAVFESLVVLRRAQRVDPALRRFERWVKATPAPLPVDAVALWLNSFLGRDAGCGAPRALWDLYTPPACVPRALRAALARPAAPADAAVLVDRGSGARAWADAPALLRRLEAWSATRAPRLRWRVFAARDGTSLADNAAAFADAALVVAAHGAGLANLVFAPPGCRVLEVPLRGRQNKTYAWLAHALGLPYRAATDEVLFTAAADPDLDALEADLAALWAADGCACDLCRGGAAPVT